MVRPRKGYAGRRGRLPSRGRRGSPEEGEEEFLPPPKSKGPLVILGGFSILAVGLIVMALVLSSNSNSGTNPDPTGASPGEMRGPPQGEARFCPSCKGTGKFVCKDCDGSNPNCSTCVGYGYLTCAACYGTGR